MNKYFVGFISAGRVSGHVNRDCMWKFLLRILSNREKYRVECAVLCCVCMFVCLFWRRFGSLSIHEWVVLEVPAFCTNK